MGATDWTVSAANPDWIREPGSWLTRFPLHSFINNEFVKSVDGKTFETINPSTEKVRSPENYHRWDTQTDTPFEYSPS